MEITEFYDTEYVQAALYQTFRSLGNYIDGLKPSSRKIVYTVDKNNITSKIKVSQLCSKVAEETQYLHGEQSLSGVVVGLARDYVGGNNISIMVPDGNFGTRYVPQASAPRYIYSYKSKDFAKIFDSRDNAILEEQFFEGEKIEYKHYVPILPLILINGSEGIGNGFAQKILPRNIEELKGEILNKLKSAKYNIKPLTPYFKGFSGTVEPNIEDHKWIVKGTFEREGRTKIHITEIPVGYDLKQYLKILDDLVENKVIKDYDDNSNDDNFDFVCRVALNFIEKTDDEIFDLLRLKKAYSENYTCINEENKVVEFTNDTELLQAFIKVRVDFYGKRKKNLIAINNKKINIAENKIRFVNAVIDDIGKITKHTKKIIIKWLGDSKFDIVDDSYDYLLRMPIYSLTKEKIKELGKDIDTMKNELESLEKKTPKKMWLEDLK